MGRTKFDKPLEDLHALWDDNLIPKLPSENDETIDDHERAVADFAIEQAQAFRMLANMIEKTGIPVKECSVSPSFAPRWQLTSHSGEELRQYARLQARFVNDSETR